MALIRVIFVLNSLQSAIGVNASVVQAHKWKNPITERFSAFPLHLAILRLELCCCRHVNC